MNKFKREDLINLYEKEKQDEVKGHDKDTMYIFKVESKNDWNFLYLKHSIVLDIIDSINDTDD